MILHTKELKGSSGKIFDLLITNQRIIGISRSGNLRSKNTHADSESSTPERLIESNPKENFGVKYEEIQSLRLQKYAFWATGTGKLLTIKFRGKALRFALLDSQDYRELKTNLSGLWRSYMNEGNEELKNSNAVSSETLQSNKERSTNAFFD